jgi:hypothetical protein
VKAFSIGGISKRKSRVQHRDPVLFADMHGNA